MWTHSNITYGLYQLMTDHLTKDKEIIRDKPFNDWMNLSYRKSTERTYETLLSSSVGNDISFRLGGCLRYEEWIPGDTKRFTILRKGEVDHLYEHTLGS